MFVSNRGMHVDLVYSWGLFPWKRTSISNQSLGCQGEDACNVAHFHASQDTHVSSTELSTRPNLRERHLHAQFRRLDSKRDKANGPTAQQNCLRYGGKLVRMRGP